MAVKLAACQVQKNQHLLCNNNNNNINQIYIAPYSRNFIGDGWIQYHTENPLTHSDALRFNGHFSGWTWVSWYQNVSILDFIGAKGDKDSADNWTYEMCKNSVKSSPPTNQHPTFNRPDALTVAQPTVSKH